jgi:predicted enzyme related to lactoylglutathione lyase
MKLSDAAVNPVLPAADLARARKFYEEMLGLSVLHDDMPNVVVFAAGEGTRLEIYAHGAPKAENTACSFAVKDIETTVQELKGNGVVFEEYDFEDFKTVDSIATMDGEKAAWFKDSEGNILCIHEEE